MSKSKTVAECPHTKAQTQPCLRGSSSSSKLCVCLKCTGPFFNARGTSQSQLSHSENLQSLPMSYHFGYAKAYAMLTCVEFFVTRSKLRKPLREVLKGSRWDLSWNWPLVDVDLPIRNEFCRTAHADTGHLTAGPAPTSYRTEPPPTDCGDLWGGYCCV
jgi:hypothetical protein